MVYPWKNNNSVGDEEKSMRENFCDEMFDRLQGNLSFINFN